MSKKTFIILFLTVCVGLNAQTRRIAHRAHSGADSKRYVANCGSFGAIPEMKKVKVHLESGRDTMVNQWDSLARPYYFYFDTLPRAQFYPKDLTPKEDIREMGTLTHKLIAKS